MKHSIRPLAYAAAVVLVAGAPSPMPNVQHDAPPSKDPRPHKGRRRKDWEQGQYRRETHR